ncbi:MAG: prenyltransferase/squalene oxidase repeat-containing protein [Planctomycetota bacterium]
MERVFLKITLILTICCIGLIFSIDALGQEPPMPPNHPPVKQGGADNSIDSEKINTAVKRGVEFLKKQQTQNGTWVSTKLHEGKYEDGVTAFVLLALLKCGVDRNDRQIAAGFNFLRSKPFKSVYTAACTILALEALYAPEEEEETKEEEDKGKKETITVSADTYEKKIWKNFRKHASPQDKKLLEDALRFILSCQQTNIWRYPGGMPGGDMPGQPGDGDFSGLEDFSNTQYAMLALYSARRLGCAVPVSTWSKVADYAIKYQEEKGPKVEWFPVPAADFEISKLKGLEEKLLKEFAQAAKKYNKELKKAIKEGKSPEEAGLQKPGDDLTTTVIDPYENKEYGAEKKDMYARGWAYLPKPTSPVTGSMTTSGVISLVICKVGLEGSAMWNGTLKEKVNAGIRDGCAWIAHNFTVSSNPNAQGLWPLYYIYGLERAGVLSLCRTFGTHSWYEEGVNYLLSIQLQDGSWSEDSNICGISNTCFALLFLKKATTPVVKLPGDDSIFTGEGLLGKKK